MQWLGERSAARFEAAPPKVGDLPAVTEANDTVKAITEAWLQKSEERPTFSELTRYLENFQRQLESEKKKQEDQAAARSAGGAGGAAAQPGEVNTVESAMAAVDAATKSMTKPVSFLIANALKSPTTYLLNRHLAWNLIPAEPPNENNVTMIPGISPDIPPLIENALSEGGFQAILTQSEARLAEYPFWLDIQRHTAECLAGLGDEYAAARGAVVGATAGFVRRLPGLPSLVFATGVPFANDRTRQWLATEVMPSGGGDGEEAEVDPREEVYREAKKLVAKGKWQDAMALFREWLDKTGSLRERFLWKFSQAKLCLEAGQTDVALPQFEALDREVTRLGLEEWEPEMALAVIKSYLQCRRLLSSSGMGMDPEVVRRMEDLKYRLARLDVASVIELNGNP
jgi:type VI secretion system protein VasJ